MTALRGPIPQARGFSVLEGLIAALVFVVLFIPLYRLYTEIGVGQQKMIRDYAVAINIAENAINLIESEIDAGNLPKTVVDEDVTELILGAPATQAAVQKMLGYGVESSVKYIPAFRLFLTARPFGGSQNLFDIRLRFEWGDQGAGTTMNKRHEFELKTLRTFM
jgi:hypothetical protein